MARRIARAARLLERLSQQERNISVSDLPPGYRDIPEEDRKKAQRFFEQGKKVADTGNFEYSIEMFLQGLRTRLAPAGVAVVTVKPGFVDPPMTAAVKKNALFASPVQNDDSSFFREAPRRGEADSRR